MALIVYTDPNGETWHVWNVDRENLDTGRYDYLGPEFRTGWLCFESTSTGERRRLAEYPKEWDKLPHQRLELLRRVATPLMKRRTPLHESSTTATSTESPADASDVVNEADAPTTPPPTAGTEDVTPGDATA